MYQVVQYCDRLIIHGQVLDPTIVHGGYDREGNHQYLPRKMDFMQMIMTVIERTLVRTIHD